MSQLFREVYSEINFLEMLRDNNSELAEVFPFIPMSFEEIPPEGMDFSNYASLLENPGIEYK
jgi:hypothetical protein